MLSVHAGQVPSHESFTGLCQAIGTVYKISPQAVAVFETVRSLPVVPLSRKGLWLFSWRIAAQSKQLLSGQPVRSWTGQVVPEWVPFEVLDTHFYRTKQFGAGRMVSLRAMGGTACGETTRKFWSHGTIRQMARLLGFTDRGKRKLPYQQPQQFVRLRFAGLVLPELSGESPMFRDVATNSGLSAWNKKLLVMRIFRKPPCPHEFSHPCHICPIGYARGELVCPAATHAETWEHRFCERCQRDAWFDNSVTKAVCLSCWEELAATLQERNNGTKAE